MLECKECQKSFTRKEHRDLHYYRNHVDKKDWPFVCKELINDVECGRRCPSKIVLNRHIKEVHPVSVIHCPYKDCQSTCKSENALNAHIKEFHGNDSKERYRCEVDGCNAYFSKKHKLKEHSFVHTGVKPFKCQHEGCNRSFMTRAQENRHVNQRHGVKQQQYKCNECEESFSYMNELTKHKKQAHKKTFCCSVCNKVFKTNVILQNHMKVHSETRKDYKCNSCEKSFTTKYNLNKHIKVKHDKVQEFTCSVCSKSYAHKKSLDKHMVEHEPGYIKPPKVPRKNKKPYKKKPKVINKDHILYMLSGLKTTEVVNNSLIYSPLP